MELFKRRYAKCRETMVERELDCVVVFPGTNMYYLTGFIEEPLERLLVAVLPRSSEPVFIVPELYEKQVKTSTWIGEVRGWKDDEDPSKILSEVLRSLSLLDGKIALDTKMWARFFLMFLNVAPKAVYSDASEVIDGLRAVKSKEEIKIMEESASIADRVIKKIIDACGVGSSEKEIVNLIELEFRKRGVESMPFRPIVASGPNGAFPHHKAGDRCFKRGDSVVLDLGAAYKGYCSDITRTIFIERVGSKEKAVYEVVREAQQLAFESIAEGVEARRVDRAARTHIADKGYGEKFIHRAGHGIGLDVHEAPYIWEGNAQILKTGMTFSVEPGIYLPDRFGVRIEDIVVVEGKKARRLNKVSRELTVI